MKSFQNLLLEEYKNNINKINKTLVVDIDGVVATIVDDGDYSKAKPIENNILLINKLKEFGLKIIYYTARGSATGKNWEQVTKDQFKEWGVMFDELKFGKPAADLYIDDKAALPAIIPELVNHFKINIH